MVKSMNAYRDILNGTLLISFCAFIAVCVLTRNPQETTRLIFLENLMNDVENINENLEKLSIPFGSTGICVSLLDLFGSLLACRRYRKSIKSAKSWYETIFSCTLMQFGGTTLTGLLLGQTPSWIISHTAFPALFVAYWMTFCCPFDLFWNLSNDEIPGVELLWLIVGVGSSISSGHAVTSWGQDKAMFNTFHVNDKRIRQSLLICVACGTLSACGGGLLTDLLGFFRIPSYTWTSTPAVFEITQFGASATLNRSLLLSILYYVLVSSDYMPWGDSLVTKETGHLIVGSLQVLNFLVQTARPDLDPFQAASSILLRCLNIPSVIQPPRQPQSTAISPSAPATTATAQSSSGKPLAQNELQNISDEDFCSSGSSLKLEITSSLEKKKVGKSLSQGQKQALEDALVSECVDGTKNLTLTSEDDGLVDATDQQQINNDPLPRQNMASADIPGSSDQLKYNLRKRNTSAAKG